MNLLAALVNQCFGPQGAGLTEINGALCLSRLPHVCFYYKYCWCNCNRCKQCRPVLGCSYRSSLIWVHPVLENNRMCQKSHKSFQRTTGQTTTDGLGVTSMSNSPLTIQRGHFMKKKLVILYTYWTKSWEGLFALSQGVNSVTVRGDSLWKLSMMLYEKGYRFFTLG